MNYTLYTSARNTDNSSKYLNVNLFHASRKCYTRNSERKKEGCGKQVIGNVQYVDCVDEAKCVNM